MPTLEEIKAKQQSTWSSGDFGITAATVAMVGDLLCEGIDLAPGKRVLDVATGSGTTALAAARRFCEVTGIDYVPALLERARRRAEAESLSVTFTEGDAEDIPFPDESFDVVLSTLGTMFAPNQERAAAELLRVCRSGGQIGLLNWTPTGFLGELFTLLGRYVPPPVELKPAALWGTEERVRELFGESVSSIGFKTGTYPFRFPSASFYVDYMRRTYGPTFKAFEALPAEKQVALERDIAALVERYNRATDGTAIFESGYLIVDARKA